MDDFPLGVDRPARTSPGPACGRARTIGARLALAAAALAAALAAVELLLRATGAYAAPMPPPIRVPGLDAEAEPFTIRDELLVFGLSPNSRTYPWYAIDEHGWRTPPFDEARPAGTFRVVATGDSCTFGISTLEPLHWTSVLRRALTGLCADVRPVEVINAGITGYSTLQNRLQVERDLAPLEPDLLVWLVSGANDTSSVDGPSDAEQVQALRSPLRALARLRVARMLGLGRHGWPGLSPNALPGSPTARPRVALDEVQRNVEAVSALLPGRLLVALFPPQPSLDRAVAVGALFERVLATAGPIGAPVIDLRPAIAALAPQLLYIDNVHPDPPGHSLVVREMLPAVLARVPLPETRREWIAAWQATLDIGGPGGEAGGGPTGRFTEQASTLAGPGAPPRFTELAALYRDPEALDARLLRGDTTLPDAVLEFDPLIGRSCRALSAARLALDIGGAGPAIAARRAELERFVRPPDPLLQAFGGEQALRAADATQIALARALLVFTAELGLVPLRADVRRGLAARAATADEAVRLLAVLGALDPGNAQARYELALALRRAGRFDDARAEWERLAAREPVGPGAPLVELARGIVAWEDGRLDESEAALRRALDGQFSLGYARTLLGRICLAQDRLDEATREFVLAAGMIGAKDQLPELMAQIAARRAELAGN